MIQEYLDAEPRSSLALLPGIVDRPGLTLAQVMAQPRWRWLLPAVLISASLVILAIVSAPYLAEQAEQQTALALQQAEAQMGGMTETQREQTREIVARFSGPVFLAATALAGSLMGLALGWSVWSAFLYFGLQIGGRDLEFSQVFAGYSWTTLPTAVASLVGAGWILLTGRYPVNPGLSYFFATGDTVADATSFLWNLAGKIDLFFLWHVVLVFFLIRATSRRGSGLLLTLAYVVLNLLLRTLPVLLAAAVSLGP